MYNPTPLQEADSDAMLRYRHALLWADAGTGKTVTAIEAYKKGGYDKLIVVAPKIALTMWHDELLFHGQMKHVHVIRTGTKSMLKKALAIVKDADALVVTFDLCRNDNVKRLLRMFASNAEACVCVLDEHQYVKGFGSGRTSAILGPLCDGRGAFTEVCEDVWFLSGDPIMNYQNDLYPALRFARPEIMAHYKIDTYDKFMNEFCVVERKRHHPKQQVVKARATADRNTKKLRHILSECGVIYRTLAEAEAGLPEITHRNVTPPIDATIPKKVIGKLTEKQVLAALNDPNSELAKTRRLLGLAKAQGVAEYAVEQAPPLLIGAWHKDVIAMIADQIAFLHPNWVIRTVSGDTPSAERDHIQAGFNVGTVDVIVGQMSAMNVSWNLQAICKHVLIAEELPSHGMVHQFYSRVMRKGQKNHVQVDHMKSDHEIDNVLSLIRSRKAATKEQLRKGI